MMEWQPIETAPRDGIGIIYYEPLDKEHYRIGGANFIDGAFRAINFFGEGEHPVINPTHWQPMPLPPAPVREGGKG